MAHGNGTTCLPRTQGGARARWGPQGSWPRELGGKKALRPPKADRTSALVLWPKERGDRINRTRVGNVAGHSSAFGSRARGYRCKAVQMLDRVQQLFCDLSHMLAPVTSLLAQDVQGGVAVQPQTLHQHANSDAGCAALL